MVAPTGIRVALGVDRLRFIWLRSAVRLTLCVSTSRQRLPRTREPRSQATGQIRDILDLTTLSALKFATSTSRFVPACSLKFSSARREAAFQSPSIFPGSHPTRFNSPCNSRAMVVRQKRGTPARKAQLRKQLHRFVGLCPSLRNWSLGQTPVAEKGLRQHRQVVLSLRRSMRARPPFWLTGLPVARVP